MILSFAACSDCVFRGVLLSWGVSAILFDYNSIHFRKRFQDYDCGEGHCLFIRIDSVGVGVDDDRVVRLTQGYDDIPSWKQSF